MTGRTRCRQLLTACVGLALAFAPPALTAATTPALPPAACDATLQAGLAAQPDDTNLRHALARACAHAGRHDQALGEYDALLAVQADNPDWLLGRAQALLALDRPQEAQASLERARSIAPDYEDVWRLSATALERAGDTAAAETLLAQAERAFPRSEWPAARRRLLAEARLLERGTVVTVAASYERLSGRRPAWQALLIEVMHPLDERRRLFAGLSAEERFGLRDGQVSAGLSQRFAGGWSVAVNSNAAPAADVLPEWGLAVDASRALSGGRALALRARHTSYAAVDVNSLAATLEQYYDRFSVGYSLTAARPAGLDWSFGYALRIAHEYGRTSHAAATVAYGEEAETVAPGTVLVTRNKSVVLHGVHWRSAVWGLAWEAGWHEQGNLYDRVRLRVGLQHRF